MKAFACAALAALAACSFSPAENSTLGSDQSRLQPASSSANDLLYASDWKKGEIFVFTYPAGTLVGKIPDDRAPLGLCSDSNGDVWVTDNAATSGQIVEYAHGGTTPIATLDDPQANPRGCAVNPLTGDLAVANALPGNVVIFANASGSALSYSAGVSYPFSCAYDALGNLYVDGYRLHNHAKFALSELRSGASEFIDVGMESKLGLPGNIQWDGTYLAAGEYPLSATIYRLKFAKSRPRAKLEGTVSLLGPKLMPARALQFWLQDGTLIMPFGRRRDINWIGLWTYPAGKRVAILKNFGAAELYGVTVSLAPSDLNGR